MPQTPSNPIEIGAPASAFRLPEPLTGRTVALDDYADAKAVVVAFISNVCPFVVLIREELNRLARDYAPKGVQVIAINSNAQEIKSDETAEKVAEDARTFGYVFPYLRDETQVVADAYQAACTPDLYVYDGARRLFYHGQFDDARPGNGIAASGSDLRGALDRLLAGQTVPEVQKPSIGCNIKWRDGDDHGVRRTVSAQAAE